MNAFDYACENVKEICEETVEMAMELGKFVLSILFAILIYGTIPLWIFPYLIIKNRKKVKQNDSTRIL